MKHFLFCILGLFISLKDTYAAETKAKYFDRAIFVIFENTNYSAALKQPFLSYLAKNGANFTNFMAITHPSQGNYIALTSGSLNGVSNDNNYDINVKNIVDLLEAKKVSWKVYAEDYPEGCFTGATRGNYVRKHNPFISYINIQQNPERCSHIVNAKQFDADAQRNILPEYVFYVPDIKNDGHDTQVGFADTWYKNKFSTYISDAKFMKGTILISSFDESGISFVNQIYTSIYGPEVKVGSYADKLNIYSLLRLIEDNWNLGHLGQNDVNAPTIPQIWLRTNN